MKKDYVTNIRCNREEKDKADEILQSLGLTFSSVINVLLKQIILTKGVPFPIVMPTDEEADEQLQAVHLDNNSNDIHEIKNPEENKQEFGEQKQEYAEGLIELAADEHMQEISEQGEIPSFEEEDDKEEPLVIENPSEVDFEDVIEDVSDSETQDETIEPTDGEDKPVSLDLNGALQTNIESSEFDSVFDAFQSMDI